MEKDKAMELDKIVFEWWYNTDGVLLLDIIEHFSGKVWYMVNVQRILKNCCSISVRNCSINIRKKV